MNIKDSIQATKQGFESSFAEKNYYDTQTKDKKHLANILNALSIKENDTILDLGTGSGYLAFEIARNYPTCHVIGLDIVSNTLKVNREKAKEQNMTNIEFIDYDGILFPFGEHSFDSIVSRYALHHFPKIEDTFQELSRILKQQGQLFISDPIPNQNDESRFIDAYMQLKNDGHIKFYTEEELISLTSYVNLMFDKKFMSKIRFPRKKNPYYLDLLRQYDHTIIKGYDVNIVYDEILITEQVINLSFIKK